MVAGQIGLSKLKNCKFIAATVDTNLGDRFEYCDFTQAKMQRVGLNGIFINCVFDKANMTKCGATNATFTHCSFRKTNLRKMELYNCTFDTCVFEEADMTRGSLAGSTFINNRPSSIQLGDTLMDGCKYK